MPAWLSFYELIGYAASALVAISLMMSSILRLRIINLIGAALFTVYGLLIGAYPVAAVNFIIVLIDLYFLYDLLTTKEYFKLLLVDQQSDYLATFLQHHAADIQKIWPGFAYQPQDGQLVYFILRNLVPAGLIVAQPQASGELLVKLDYAIPGYRDFKLGRFVYNPQSELLAQRPFHTITATAQTPIHAQYLQRMGFQQQPNSNRYHLTLTNR